MYYFNYLHINNPKARQVVIEQMNNHNLIDICREFYPDVKRYTWRKPNPLKQARLDFILVSNSLICNVKSCDILGSYRSDHSAVMLNLHFSVFKHGKGLWKFNNVLLNEPQYNEMINNHIKEIKRQYAVPIYVQNFINEIPDSEIQFMFNDQLFLETLLIEIRAKTISFGSYVKKKNANKEKKT